MTDTDTYVTNFTNSINELYELEDQEFLAKLGEFFTLYANQLADARVEEALRNQQPKKKRASSGPRKKTAYNIFIKTVMKNPEIVSIEPPKDRLPAARKLWTEASDETKAIYTKLADEENEKLTSIEEN